MKVLIQHQHRPFGLHDLKPERRNHQPRHAGENAMGLRIVIGMVLDQILPLRQRPGLIRDLPVLRIDHDALARRHAVRARMLFHVVSRNAGLIACPPLLPDTRCTRIPAVARSSRHSDTKASGSSMAGCIPSGPVRAYSDSTIARLRGLKNLDRVMQIHGARNPCQKGSTITPLPARMPSDASWSSRLSAAVLRACQMPCKSALPEV